MKKLIFTMVFFMSVSCLLGQENGVQLNNKNTKQQRHYWALSGSIFANIPTKSHYLDYGYPTGCGDCYFDSLSYHYKTTFDNINIKAAYNLILHKGKVASLNFGISSGFIQYHYKYTIRGWYAGGLSYQYWEGEKTINKRYLLYVFQPYLSYKANITKRLNIINQINLGIKVHFYTFFKKVENGTSNSNIESSNRYNDFDWNYYYEMAYKLGLNYNISQKFYIQAYGLLPYYFTFQRFTNKINGKIPFIQTGIELSYRLD